MTQPLLHALLFGRFEDVPENTAFLFQRTGLTPLFTASGFHLWGARTLADTLTYPARRLFSAERAGRLLGFSARIALMVYFATLTDWSSPLVRAFLFVSLGEGARLLEIQADRAWIFLLALSGSALLGKGSPVSFLFSMAGLAGLVFVQPRHRWMIALGPWLFCLPLTIWCFSLFSPLAPLWNLTFGVAIAWLVLPLAMLALMAENLGIPTSRLADAAGALMNLLTAALERCAELAGHTYWVRPLPCLALAVALAISAYLWRHGRRRAGWALGTAAAALVLALPLPALSALDVGRGDSILVRGEILTDVGPPGFHGFPAPAAHSLEALGVGDLGGVMLSHFDLDHRGGLDSLLARHRVSGALWFRAEDIAAKRHEKVLAAAERAGVPVRFVDEANAPPGFQCWLAPFRSDNDSCPLCRAWLKGATSVLLTGDMSEKAEAWFVENLNPFPTASILKVAHHGSRGSSSAEFLRASGARLALVSVGARNRYHHPNPETLERLLASGMRIRRTDKEGTLNEGYFSFLTDEIIRPVLTANSRVYPGSPATAR
ncbi:MAG: ComEC/Rec2 family competence protein [Bdellovibrionota bacterium]